MAPPSGCPAHAIAEVDALKKGGMDVELVEVAGQCYARVSLTAPSPPWDRSAYRVLIAIPLAYPTALDAFYLEHPYSFKGGTHPRAQGATISHDNRAWQLVSWHYADQKQWVDGTDNLETHIQHCRGFFLHRGATNAM